MTKAFLYSFFLHSTIVLSVLALMFVYRSDDMRVKEKRCMIMLSQVCEFAPAQTKPNAPAVKKEKAPLKKVEPKRKEVTQVVKKKAPSPVAQEQAVIETTAEIPEVIEEAAVEPAEPVLEVAEAEMTESSNAPVGFSSAAQKATEEKPTDNVTPEESYISENIAAIMALLRKNLYYPRMARKRFIQGEVYVRFELLESGAIQNITVTEAQDEILAHAAVTTIERLDGKFPLPKERLVLNVPIVYELH